LSNTGWVSPGTVVSDDAVGSVAWSNPSNATTSDDSYASFSTTTLVNSEYLRGSSFGFSVPSNATIDGIEVSYEDKFGFTGDSGNLAGEVKLSLFGSGGALGNAKYSVFIYQVDTVQTLGGSEDTWGATLTPEDVNNSSFGAAYYVEGANGDFVEFFVDHIQVKVYYTESSTPTVGVKYPLPAFKSVSDGGPAPSEF
jgi:hypothetical protein